jgi:O-antigen ligase
VTAGVPAPARRLAHRYPATVVATALSVIGLVVPRGSGAGKALIVLFVVAVIGGAARRPAAAVVALCIVLPLTPMVPALLHRVAPAAALGRALSIVDDGLAAGIALAGVLGAVRARRRPDVVDGLALLWLAVVTLHLFVHFDGIAGPTRWSQLLGWRTDGVAVVLLLGARHAGLTTAAVERFRQVLIASATFVALAVLVQFAVAGWWETVVVDGTGLRTYLGGVLGVRAGGVDDTLRWLAAGRSRPSGVLLSPFDASDFCLLGLAPALHLALRRRLPLAVAASGVLVAAVVVTRTRIAVLALLVMVLLAVRLAGLRRLPKALGVAAAVLAIAAVVVVATREVGSGAGSSSVHLDELRAGARYVADHPWGVGLGTLPPEQHRFGGPGTPVSDNAFLQTAGELGIPGVAVFVALLTGLAVALAARRRAAPDDPLAEPMLVAFAGLLVTGLLHQVWLEQAATWLAWTAAGLGTRRTVTS